MEVTEATRRPVSGARNPGPPKQWSQRPYCENERNEEQKGQLRAEASSRWRDSQTCLKARGKEAQGATFGPPGGKQVSGWRCLCDHSVKRSRAALEERLPVLTQGAGRRAAASRGRGPGWGLSTDAAPGTQHLRTVITSLLPAIITQLWWDSQSKEGLRRHSWAKYQL